MMVGSPTNTISDLKKLTHSIFYVRIILLCKITLLCAMRVTP